MWARFTGPTRSGVGLPPRRTQRPDSLGHPIAPTEFPGGPSTAGAVEPVGLRALRYGTPRRRIPAARHARRRIQAAACPQMFRANVGHRPVIHSPQRHPLQSAGCRRPAANQKVAASLGEPVGPRIDRVRSVVRTCRVFQLPQVSFPKPRSARPAVRWRSGAASDRGAPALLGSAIRPPVARGHALRAAACSLSEHGLVLLGERQRPVTLPFFHLSRWAEGEGRQTRAVSAGHLADRHPSVRGAPPRVRGGISARF